MLSYGFRFYETKLLFRPGPEAIAERACGKARPNSVASASSATSRHRAPGHAPTELKQRLHGHRRQASGAGRAAAELGKVRGQPGRPSRRRRSRLAARSTGVARGGPACPGLVCCSGSSKLPGLRDEAAQAMAEPLATVYTSTAGSCGWPSAKVSPLDRAFLYRRRRLRSHPGVWRARAFLLDAHLTRLERSLAVNSASAIPTAGRSG